MLIHLHTVLALFFGGSFFVFVSIYSFVFALFIMSGSHSAWDRSDTSVVRSTCIYGRRPSPSMIILPRLIILSTLLLCPYMR